MQLRNDLRFSRNPCQELKSAEIFWISIIVDLKINIFNKFLRKCENENFTASVPYAISGIKKNAITATEHDLQPSKLLYCT